MTTPTNPINPNNVVTPWSTVGFLTYARTYSRRKENGTQETFEETIDRCLNACDTQLGVGFTPAERGEFRDLLLGLKCSFAGRFMWQLGTRTVDDLGLPSLQNCAGVVIDSPVRPFTWAMDMLMLGSGVGFSVEKKHLKKLPKVRKNFVAPTCVNHAGADFIVPDTREGWVRLLGKTLKSAFLETKPKCTFTYSTQLIRGKGAPIKGFGGVASGPEILVEGITKISKIIEARRGQKITAVDAMDMMNIIGEIVIAGNVRRSSEIALGDSDDIHYLEAKRWDLKAIPSHRSSSNNSVVCSDITKLPETFWEGYRGNGEPYGIINMDSSRKQGRFGDERYPDQDVVVYNPCVTGDTEILTDQGYQRIDALVGVEVNVWNGFEWSVVQPRVTGRNRPIVNVTLSNGRTLKCTKNHTFVVSTDYHGREARVQAGDLQGGEKLIKHSYPVLEGTENLPHAYTQGFVSGDGMNNTTLYVYAPKECCLKRLEGSIKLIREEENNKRFRAILNFKPYPKTYVPHNVALMSRLDWLAGLFDADGCVLKEGGIQVASVDRTFLLDVQKMLTTTGVGSKVVLGRTESVRLLPDQHGGQKLYPCQTIWRLLVGACEVQQLVKLGLTCERLNLNGYVPNRNAGRFVTVVEVEEGEEAEVVYCFTEPKRNLGCFDGIVTGQCSEQSLNNYETCALAEVFLPNCLTREELRKSVMYLYRAVKHSLRLPCHHPETEDIVHKNMRMGIGATGYLQATEEQRSWLPGVYEELRAYDVEYSKSQGFPASIKLTTQKPSGTLSLLPGVTPGIHPGYAQYMIRRIQFSVDSPLLPKIREHGYPTEYRQNFDGSLDYRTVVASFPFSYPEGTKLAKDMSAIDQLDVVRRAQLEWSDNAVSCTVYYRKEELPGIRAYLADYWHEMKAVSFLLHSDHGFSQAPYQEITKEEYDALVARTRLITSLDGAAADDGPDYSTECAGGSCPIR